MRATPKRTAVLVIDMHRGSLEPPGTVFVPGADAIVPSLASFLSSVRDLDTQIVYLVHALDPTGREAANPFWRESDQVSKLYPNVAEQVTGSHWTEIPEAIKPDGKDLVLSKKRYGAFAGNGLLERLRMWSVDTLVVCGVLTEICVLATAFEGFNNDFRIIVASDCVKGRDESCEAAALAIVAREIGWVMPSPTIVDLLARGGSPR